tara:strand:+ start:275 stop:1024 length:750 start_codon:yes stop_codon:yes gene_type:complete
MNININIEETSTYQLSSDSEECNLEFVSDISDSDSDIDSDITTEYDSDCSVEYNPNDIADNIDNIDSDDILISVKYCKCCQKYRNKKAFFKKTSDIQVKTCIYCRKKNVKYIQENQLCKCGNNKYRCPNCTESKFSCPHNKYKYNCKICNDTQTIIIRNWRNSSKQKDISYKKYNKELFVTTSDLKELLDKYTKCIYCEVPFGYINWAPNLVSLERKNNYLGHIKGNCVLCCLKCNHKKISNKTYVQGL